jgi:hypothetical protein
MMSYPAELRITELSRISLVRLPAATQGTAELRHISLEELSGLSLTGYIFSGGTDPPGSNPKFDTSVIFTVNYSFRGRRHRQRDDFDD